MLCSAFRDEHHVFFKGGSRVMTRPTCRVEKCSKSHMSACVKVFKCRGSSQVRSRVFQISRVGSGRVASDPELMKRSHHIMTRKNQVTNGFGQQDARGDRRVGSAHPARGSPASKPFPCSPNVDLAQKPNDSPLVSYSSIRR